MKSASLEQMMADMNNGTYDLTCNGECTQCGNCCSNLLPMTEDEIATIHNSYENGYNSTRGADKKTISKVDDVDLLLKLYKSKMYYKDIAKVFGVNKETIVRALASLNVGKRRMKITKEYLLENISKTNKQIAKELNVDDETVSRAFKRYSIKRGKGCNNMLNPQNQKGYRSRLMNTEIWILSIKEARYKYVGWRNP